MLKKETSLERKMRRRRARGAWRHDGGGCFVGRMSEDVEYPCDDDYVNVRSGERASFSTTEEAHARMPSTARGLCDLEALPGVELARRWFPEDEDEL